MKIILGTTSPYRIEAFKFLEIDFTAEGSKVDESQVDRNNPEELVKELSKLKAEKLLYHAQQSVDDMVERKTQIERRLKEFLSAEKELIKKYESEEE